MALELLVAASRVHGVGIGAPALPDTQVRARVLLAIARGRAHVEFPRRGVGDAVDALHVVQRPVPVGAHAGDNGPQGLVVDAHVLVTRERGNVAQAHRVLVHYGLEVVHRVLVELVVDVAPDRLLQLDDEALDVGFVVGKKRQLVAHAAQHLGYCLLHFVHAAEDEVLGPVGVVLCEREQVIRMVEVVIRLSRRAPPRVHLVPSRAAIGLLGGRGVLQQHVVRAHVHVASVHVEFDLCLLWVRHRHQIPERYNSISHVNSAVSV